MRDQLPLLVAVVLVAASVGLFIRLRKAKKPVATPVGGILLLSLLSAGWYQSESELRALHRAQELFRKGRYEECSGMVAKIQKAELADERSSLLRMSNAMWVGEVIGREASKSPAEARRQIESVFNQVRVQGVDCTRLQVHPGFVAGMKALTSGKDQPLDRLRATWQVVDACMPDTTDPYPDLQQAAIKELSVQANAAVQQGKSKDAVALLDEFAPRIGDKKEFRTYVSQHFGKLAEPILQNAKKKTSAGEVNSAIEDLKTASKEHPGLKNELNKKAENIANKQDSQIAKVRNLISNEDFGSADAAIARSVGSVDSSEIATLKNENRDARSAYESRMAQKRETAKNKAIECAKSAVMERLNVPSSAEWGECRILWHNIPKRGRMSFILGVNVSASNAFGVMLNKTYMVALSMDSEEGTGYRMNPEMGVQAAANGMDLDSQVGIMKIINGM